MTKFEKDLRVKGKSLKWILSEGGGSNRLICTSCKLFIKKVQS